jgi:hypothetical protein
MRRNHSIVSIILIMGGLLIIGFSYWIFAIPSSVPLVALGVACIILGATAAALPRQLTASPAMQMLLGSTALAIDSTLEEIINDKQESGDGDPKSSNQDSASGPLKLQDTIYLPPSREGTIYAYVPLQRIDITHLNFEEISKAPIAFRKGMSGVRILPIAAEIGKIPELSSNEEDRDNEHSPALDEALEFILISSAELCSNLNIVEVGNELILEMIDIKVTVEAKNYTRVLGSIPASIAACAIASVTRKPVIIQDETRNEKSLLVRFRLLDNKRLR